MKLIYSIGIQSGPTQNGLKMQLVLLTVVLLSGGYCTIYLQICLLQRVRFVNAYSDLQETRTKWYGKHPSPTTVAIEDKIQQIKIMIFKSQNLHHPHTDLWIVFDNPLLCPARHSHIGDGPAITTNLSVWGIYLRISTSSFGMTFDQF